MQKAMKKKTVPIAFRLEQIDYKRMLVIIKRDSKYLNQTAFVRDAVKQKIELEE